MKVLISILLVLSCLCMLVACDSADTGKIQSGTDSENYNKAMALIDSGNYADAYDLLMQNTNYLDAKEILAHFTVQYGSTSCIIEVYDNEGSVVQSQTQHVEYEFDSKGNILSAISRFSEGYQKVTYTYDENGNKTLVQAYDQSGVLFSKYVYEYNEQGNLAYYKCYGKDGGLTRKTQYEYDANGNQTLEAVYDAQDFLESKEVWEYDANSNCTLHAQYGNYSKLQFKYTFQYDDRGNQILQYTYGTEDAIKEISVFTYDEFGNKVENAIYWNEARMEKDQWSYKTVCQYDANGNVLKREAYNDGYAMPTVTSSSKYEYDSNGNVTLYIWFKSNGSEKQRKEYTYHPNGVIKSKTVIEDSSCTVSQYNMYGEVTEYIISNLDTGRVYQKQVYTYTDACITYTP